MGMSAGFAIAPEVLDQAIAWSVRLHAHGKVDDAVSRALTEWRLASMQHEHAWQAIQSAEHDMLGGRQMPSKLLLSVLDGSAQEMRARRRQLLKLLGLGGVALGTGWLASAEAGRMGWGADYATASGERRQVHLADGTVLHLNTATTVDVRFDAQARHIFLRRGEVLIETGKDAATPAGRRRFWVNTDEGRLEAIGTRFLVRQDSGETRLQVQEGRVAMYAGADMRQIAQADEAFALQRDGTVRPLAQTGFDHAAWSEDMLVAKQMRLADFIAELARYRSGWLRCDDAAVDLIVSGVFQLKGDDPSAHVLEALTASLPIRIESHTRYWTRISLR